MRTETLRWWALFILYNGLLMAVSVLLLPLLLYSTATSVKRRRTFRHRMGWCRYAWQNAGDQATAGCIWVHALSVGEVQAAQSMITRLRTLRPQARICFSASTYTGFQIAQQLFDRRDRVDLAYFPYDWVWSVRKVIQKINPSMVILTETDIWPNFVLEMHRRSIPVYLVNFRMSENSWKTYLRFKRLAGIIFNGFAKIAVQDQKDFMRLTSLGVPPGKVAVTGNIKFDSKAHAMKTDAIDKWQKKLRIPSGKQVVMAGSTHEGEEIALLAVLKTLLAGQDYPVLVLAPRDPMRSAQILKLCDAQGLMGIALSSMVGQTPGSGYPHVVVVDSIGALKILYGLADIVFVGGSLVPCGGHNPLEPAAWAKPIVFGSDMSDFLSISRLLIEARAAQQVRHTAELGPVISGLLADPQRARRMGRRAIRVFNEYCGSVDKTLEFLGFNE